MGEGGVEAWDLTGVGLCAAGGQEKHRKAVCLEASLGVVRRSRGGAGTSTGAGRGEVVRKGPPRPGRRQLHCGVALSGTGWMLHGGVGAVGSCSATA